MVLTRGDRPADLDRTLHSVLDQRGEPVEVVVVGNGVADGGWAASLPPGVRGVGLPDNVGIPAGRNAGVAATSGEIVMFLDDDATLVADDFVERLRALVASAPDLGIVGFRIVDLLTGRTMRRHVPRLRASDPQRSSDVTVFLGGACAIRRAVFDTAGPLPDCFFYGHEELDLAWRALDAHWRIRYAADLVVHHPATSPARHQTFYRLNARNRVWVARRNLPVPLVAAYLAVWIVLTVIRVRSPAALGTWARGFVEGWRSDPGARRPIAWSTVWRMTRLGRPPVV